MKMIKLFFVVALLALALTGCVAPAAPAAEEAAAPAAEEAAPAAAEGPAGVFRSPMRTGCAVGTLWTTCGRRLDEAFLQGLAQVKWTADGVEPLLAESWEMEEGGQAFVFHLREGVTWHDGEPFTADDVVFSFNIFANPTVGSTYGPKLADVVGYDEFQAGTATELAGVTKIDDMTVRVELKSPSPLWVDLQQISISILPNHILGSVPADQLRTHGYWKNVVGTGPFVMTKFVDDQYIEGVANENYFLGKPKLDKSSSKSTPTPPPSSTRWKLANSTPPPTKAAAFRSTRCSVSRPCHT
jgi:peptide/nickel transport system substrate-binding protein